MTTRKEIFGTDNLVTEDEMETIALAAAKGTPGGFTEEDFLAFVEWGNRARIQNAMLRTVLSGKILLNIDGLAESPTQNFIMKIDKS